MLNTDLRPLLKHCLGTLPPPTTPRLLICPASKCDQDKRAICNNVSVGLITLYYIMSPLKSPVCVHVGGATGRRLKGGDIRHGVLCGKRSS